MRRGISIFILSAMPFAALALDFSDRTEAFNDHGTLSVAERVGVSVLMRAGAVEGNPDGFYRPRRLVNRAEFLKIAAISAGLEGDADVPSCFPDVPKGAWFHPSVCAAKQRNIVSGNPDGFFHPERPVNYVEALKILAELYNYDLPEPLPNTSVLWYTPYLGAASEHGIAMGISPSTPLTRALVALLAAAALAESEGALEEYRAAERGEIMSSSSSLSSSSLSSHSSTSSNVSSSSSSVPVSSLPDLPARSRFLILGERSEPIASANFFSHQEAMIVRGATVKFKNEAKSIDALTLISSSGAELGRLTLDVYDSTKKTWKATFSSGDGYTTLKQDQENTLAIEALLKGPSSGGFSEEMIQVDDFSLTVEGGFTHNTYASRPVDFPFPQHQTSFARITGVTNALEISGGLPVGNDELIAGFTFRAEEISQANTAISELEFEISKSSNVQSTGFTLEATDTNTTVECTVAGNVVTCANIPEELGALQAGSRTLRLSADILLSSGAQNPFLQISLNQPGAIGTNGGVRWTDGSGDFNWMELAAPVARGTRWE